MSFQILIVDDDREFREEMLECLSDYKVIEAMNGHEALKILSKPHAIDLVILDIFMPGPSGLEVLKEIKRLAPEIFVVILTGQSSKDSAIEALKSQANDYIEKPFEIEHLLEIVEGCLKLKASKGISNKQGLQAKLHLAKEFIDRNWDKMLTLEFVADHVNLSPKYLSRIFKERTGQGFNEYRLMIKINEAKKLLKKSDFSVGQVSKKLGYKNLESFVRIFKQIEGSSPAKYRKTNERSR